ncbi:MAG: VCBS repeat-containing protein, partial [Planctomycetota bacterium]|nr:VCBS repeat-containing protein [Planctomycetota bacterium]
SETGGDIDWYKNNNGDGTSWTIASVSAGAIDAQDVHIADMDGDGDLDIVWAEGSQDRIRWYKNNE